MANYTKTQFKKRIEDLKEKLISLRLEFEELQSDLQSESDDIVPYENRNDLVPAQEQRQEWLDNTAQSIEYVVDSMNEAESNIDEIEE